MTTGHCTPVAARATEAEQLRREAAEVRGKAERDHARAKDVAVAELAAGRITVETGEKVLATTAHSLRAARRQATALEERALLLEQVTGRVA